MAITTDAPVPHEVIDEIVALDGFIAGRSVSLSAQRTTDSSAPSARAVPRRLT